MEILKLFIEIIFVIDRFIVITLLVNFNEPPFIKTIFRAIFMKAHPFVQDENY